MKRKDFDNLKNGYLCVFKRGHDKDKRGMVVFKEDETILLKSVDEPFSKITHSNDKFRLTNMREIDTM